MNILGIILIGLSAVVFGTAFGLLIYLNTEADKYFKQRKREREEE